MWPQPTRTQSLLQPEINLNCTTDFSPRAYLRYGRPYLRWKTDPRCSHHYGSWSWYQSTIKQWDRWCHWYHPIAPAPCLQASQVSFSRKVSIHSSPPTPNHILLFCSLYKGSCAFFKVCYCHQKRQVLHGQANKPEGSGLAMHLLPSMQTVSVTAIPAPSPCYIYAMPTEKNFFFITVIQKKTYVIKKYPCSWSTTKLSFSYTQQLDLPGKVHTAQAVILALGSGERRECFCSVSMKFCIG